MSRFKKGKSSVEAGCLGSRNTSKSDDATDTQQGQQEKSVRKATRSRGEDSAMVGNDRTPAHPPCGSSSPNLVQENPSSRRDLKKRPTHKKTWFPLKGSAVLLLTPERTGRLRV